METESDSWHEPKDVGPISAVVEENDLWKWLKKKCAVGVIGHWLQAFKCENKSRPVLMSFSMIEFCGFQRDLKGKKKHSDWRKIEDHSLFKWNSRAMPVGEDLVLHVALASYLSLAFLFNFERVSCVFFLFGNSFMKCFYSWEVTWWLDWCGFYFFPPLVMVFECIND